MCDREYSPYMMKIEVGVLLLVDGGLVWKL